MLHGPFTVNEPVLGIDLGDSTVRALQISGSRKAASLDAAGEAALGKNIIVGDQIMDKEALVKAIQGLMDRPTFGRFTSKRVVAGLPEAKCFVRVIHVDKMPERELSAAIPFEAESYIPLPLDQVYLDWQPLVEKDGRLEVLLIASPKEYVDKLAECLIDAGLEPSAFEVQCQGLARATLVPEDKGTVMLVDIETARTVIAVAENGSVRFTSTIPLAGIALTETIARGLGVDAQKAEEIKKRVGFANTPEYPNLKTLMTPVLSSFVSELKNVITYNSAHGNALVTKVLLCGGGAQLTGLNEFVASEFSDLKDIVVGLGDPLINVHVVRGRHGDQLTTMALGYGTAVGLALREVNL